MKNKSVNIKDVILVEDGETIAVVSRIANETYCFGISENGNSIRLKKIQSADLREVSSVCVSSEFPNKIKFQYTDLNNHSVYLKRNNEDEKMCFCFEEKIFNSKWQLMLSNKEISYSNNFNINKIIDL